MRRSSIGVLLVVALLACNAEQISADPSAFAGDYLLRSINGNALPYALANTATLTLTETSETFSLLSSGNFVDITHYQRTQNGVTDAPADTLMGTFVVRGQTINFTDTKGDLFAGTMGTSDFTVEGSSTVFYYSK